jgi:hypothetical protein
LIVHALLALLPLAAAATPATPTPCAAFEARLHSTYGFRPSKLDEAARNTKSGEMDAIWKAVEKDPATLAPCLKAALAEPTEDTWFLFDGSQLLNSVDHSLEAKRMLMSALTRVPLDDVDLRSWVGLASEMGLEGFDTSALGRRWLSYPKASYYLPEHAAYHVDRENGAMFIFGTMEERFATPVLIELSRRSLGETREIAVGLLMSQATPEALRAMAKLDPSGLSPEVVASWKALLKEPALISPRKPPLTTRAEFLAAFQSFLDGNPAPFNKLVDAVPDGERDLVAVSTPTDLEIIRKVRRRYMAANNQHAIEYYNQFSQILMTLVWNKELVGGNQ